MSESLLILSDIHGNLSALDSVLGRVDEKDIKGIILLGDIIDYGPRSNEVIKRLKDIPNRKVYANIWGNHENAIMTENYERFSSERGRVSARHTKKLLTEEATDYILGMNQAGQQEFMLGGKKCLAVHASLEDVYWRSIDIEKISDNYIKYDYVFSGHSHIPHCIQKFYKGNDAEYRNKKRTVFINPGSVGQPRNHNPYAQYALLDIHSGSVNMMAVEYDIGHEMELFSEEIDVFYKERIKIGI